ARGVSRPGRGESKGARGPQRVAAQQAAALQPLRPGARTPAPLRRAAAPPADASPPRPKGSRHRWAPQVVGSGAAIWYTPAVILSLTGRTRGIVRASRACRAATTAPGQSGRPHARRPAAPSWGPPPSLPPAIARPVGGTAAARRRQGRGPARSPA